MRRKSKIDEATSMTNGIRFRSKRHKGYIAVATADEKGEINTTWTTIKEYKTKDHLDMVSVLILIVSAIIMNFMLDYIEAKFPEENYIYSIRLFFIYLPIILILELAINVYKNQKTELFKYHAAEHMVLNAYREINRIPSLEEIKHYSRFSNTCGSNLSAMLIITFPLYFSCTFISNIFISYIAVFAIYILNTYCNKHGYLNFIQNFVTVPPEEKHLQVAIAGMQTWLENEEKD